MVFPIAMYGCESWTKKKAERQRIDAFELWCWRRLLRVPWTARRSNQSILKEISPEYSLEGLMLKLKLQYFGHLMWRIDSLEKTLMLGKIEGERRRGQQRMRGWMASPTRRTWVWASSRSWWWTGKPGMLGIHEVANSQTWPSDWTEQNCVSTVPPYPQFWNSTWPSAFLPCLKELFLLAIFPSQVELVKMKRGSCFFSSAPTTKCHQIQPTVDCWLIQPTVVFTIEKKTMCKWTHVVQTQVVQGQLSRYQAAQEKIWRQERVSRLQQFC